MSQNNLANSGRQKDRMKIHNLKNNENRQSIYVNQSAITASEVEILLLFTVKDYRSRRTGAVRVHRTPTGICISRSHGECCAVQPAA